MVRRNSIHHHFARSLVPLVALIATAGSAANEPADYSFRSTDGYLARAQDSPRWADLMARHNAQAPEIDACINDTAACPASLTGYREVIRMGATLSAPRKMRLANSFINARRWDVEARHDDTWRTLEDFLRVGGDCEDFAIAKYFVLRALGFAIDDLRVAIEWDLETRAYHAVTLVRLDDTIYILDVDGAPRRSSADYRFYFAFNETAIWDLADSNDSARRDRRHHDGDQGL
jgi:predicted transglutaminase-like cysteine proteinase